MPISKTNVVLIAFRGGVEGDGKAVPESQAGTAGKIVSEVRQRALVLGMQFSWVIVEPGVTSQVAVATALAFVKKYATTQSRVIVYGYSRGGDAAVDLAKSMQNKPPPIDLLITVDAAYGPLSQPVPLPVFGAPGSLPPMVYPPPTLQAVDRKVPANVAVNLNYYQTEPSGPSSASRAGQASGSGASSNEGRSSHSNSGKSDSIGSHGGPNTAIAAGNTRVFNQQVHNTSHGEIDEKTRQAVVTQIGAFLRSDSIGRRWTPMPASTSGL